MDAAPQYGAASPQTPEQTARKMPQKDPAGLRSFEYHCADSYWCCRRTAEHIFGEEGKAAAEQVLEELEAAFGKKARERILLYSDTDFTACDSREVQQTSQ